MNDFFSDWDCGLNPGLPPGWSSDDMDRDEEERREITVAECLDALRACKVFITPINKRRMKDYWDEYHQDAENRIRDILTRS